MTVYQKALQLDRATARVLFDERHGRTVSRVIGAEIGVALGVTAVVGTVLFHAALLAAIGATLAGGVWYWRRKRR